MTRVSIRSLLVGCALATFAAGCGAPVISAPCLVPPDPIAAMASLQGAWTLLDRAGDNVGSVAIEGELASITSTPDDTTFFGRLALEQATGNEYRLAFFIESAQVGAVRHEYGEVTSLSLLLVFADDSTAYSLQPDGLWLQWERAL
jgi:hypothetical protein